MYKCYQLLSAIGLILLAGCAKSTPSLEPTNAILNSSAVVEKRIADKNRSLKLPGDWSSLDYASWINAAGLTGKCLIDTTGNPDRFTQKINVSKDTWLLLLACELGAYQDGYYIFTVDTAKNVFTPLELMTPKEKNSSWTFTETNLIWGSVWIKENSTALEVIFLSAATGMCGHRSVYPIAMLTNNQPVTPLSAYADTDCYNGIQVEAWPPIK